MQILNHSSLFEDVMQGINGLDFLYSTKSLWSMQEFIHCLWIYMNIFKVLSKPWCINCMPLTILYASHGSYRFALNPYPIRSFLIVLNMIADTSMPYKALSKCTYSTAWLFYATTKFSYSESISIRMSTTGPLIFMMVLWPYDSYSSF